jgi:hypothetical protein
MQSTIGLLTSSSTGHDYSLAGATPNGALYKDVSRALSQPRTLQFTNNVGAPGAKANDKVIVRLSDTVLNTETGIACTGSVTLTISVPRDTAFADGSTEALLYQMADLLGQVGARGALSDALVPSDIHQIWNA